jgi:hypothetical protein
MYALRFPPHSLPVFKPTAESHSAHFINVYGTAGLMMPDDASPDLDPYRPPRVESRLAREPFQYLLQLRRQLSVTGTLCGGPFTR